MHRLFVAIRPPEEVRDQLIDIMDDGLPFHWQSDDQLHLTLRFIGEVERPVAEDVAVALERVRFPRFSLAIAGVGRFDHRNRGVLWASVEPKEQVKALAAKVERACLTAGLAPETRAYHPHITLARWKGAALGLTEFVDRNASVRSEAWSVDRFILYESRLHRDGAHYEEVAEFPFGCG